MTLVKNTLLLLVGIKVKRIVLTTLMHQDVNHLQMVRNTLLLLVVKLLRDMSQHLRLKKYLRQVQQVNLLLRLKKYLRQVQQVNLLLRLKKYLRQVQQVNLHRHLNYS